MKIGDNSFIEWTEKIESISSVRNPLGLWSHLNIQVDYVPGITSVTNRIRYYSLLAWYYERLLDKKIITYTNLEKLFLLTCLSHHDGNYNDSALLHVFNKQRFKNEWAAITYFNLEFPINGFGKTYYNRQLEILRCCWSDSFNEIHKSQINAALITVFPDVSDDFFNEKRYSRKKILDNFEKFCICKHYSEEIEVMTKILFGFIKHKGLNWTLDEDAYSKFMQNLGIDLDFKGHGLDTQEELGSYQDTYIELGQRRRNTLLMFLKIINDTEPQLEEYRHAIWDATYFKQNTKTRENIEFKGLSKIVSYWEFLQLNVYYVYAIEMIFNVVQELIYDESGIRKTEVFKSLEQDLIFKNLSILLNKKVNENTTIAQIRNAVFELSTPTAGLKNDLNEAVIYGKIQDSDKPEEILATVLLMLLLLKRRYASINQSITQTSRIDTNLLIEDTLRIDSLFKYTDKNESQQLTLFFEYLIKNVIERHLYESTVRMRWGTKNWLFVEEDGRLFFSKKQMSPIHPRDNRWGSILSLMRDIELVRSDKKITLTEKGKKWLKLAKLI